MTTTSFRIWTTASDDLLHIRVSPRPETAMACTPPHAVSPLTHSAVVWTYMWIRDGAKTRVADTVALVRKKDFHLVATSSRQYIYCTLVLNSTEPKEVSVFLDQ